MSLELTNVVLKYDNAGRIIDRDTSRINQCGIEIVLGNLE